LKALQKFRIFLGNFGILEKIHPFVLLAVVRFFSVRTPMPVALTTRMLKKHQQRCLGAWFSRPLMGPFLREKTGAPWVFLPRKMTKKHGVVKLTRGEDMYIKVPNETWLFLGRWVMIFGETFV